MVINCKKIADEINSETKNEIIKLKGKNIFPKLAIIMVGDDAASRIYVKNKIKLCDKLGVRVENFCLPENTTQSRLIDIINDLNSNSTINGILVQLPLPKHIDKFKIAESISPMKDVDVFNPINFGRLALGNTDLISCTAHAIIKVLEHEKVDVSGKNCVIVGRSNIVGKPTALMLMKKDATVTVCHSKTTNLNNFCKNADILVSAVGKPKFIKRDMVKHGAVVIDVGINRDEYGKVCGDVDFDEVSMVASLITPVPGGIGPITVAMLLHNTVLLAKSQNIIT